MKAIVNTAPGQLAWQDWPDPQPGPGQVVIRTNACGVCATDLEMIDGWERTGFPTIPGHEWAGVVEAVGAGVDTDLVGRATVGDNIWPDDSEVGFEHPGGYAERFVTRAELLHPLPADFPAWQAALVEPLAVCVRGMRRLRLEDRGSALVIGDGPIGLLMLLLLRDAGVDRVDLVGGRPARLAVAERLGAARTLNYHQTGEDLTGAIKTLGGAYPNVIEASGSVSAMRTALGVAGRCGKVLVLGDYGDAGRADFRWNDLLHAELEVIGSCTGAEAWPQAVRLAAGGAVPLAGLVTHRLPAERFAEAMDLARHDRNAIKVVLEWPA